MRGYDVRKSLYQICETNDPWLKTQGEANMTNYM